MITVVFQDPYFMKNHLGSYECKLCLTLHNNEVSSYISCYKHVHTVQDQLFLLFHVKFNWGK